MNTNLQKRALVTGGSGDLGGAICRRLAADGLHVIVHANANLARAGAVVADIRKAGGSAEAVAFRWDALPASALTRPASQAARDWECGVVQPLRDLGQALGQGGRALGTALAGVAGAGGRFAAGLARFALLRIAAPLKRRSV